MYHHNLCDELNISPESVTIVTDNPTPGENVSNDFYREDIRPMTFDRPYIHQKQSYEQLNENKNLLLMLDTSAGKTHCVLPYAAQIIKDGGHVLYLCPTVGLMDNITDEVTKSFEKINIRPPQTLNRFIPPHKRDLDNPMIITSIFSLDHLLNNLKYPLEKLKLIIIDEVHLLVNEVGGHASEIMKRLLIHINYAGKDTVQFALLSATLSQPLNLAKKLTYQPVESFAVIDKSTEKKGKKTYLLSETPIDIEAFCLHMISQNKKVLVFIDNINETNAMSYNIPRAMSFNSQTTKSDRETLCTKLESGEVMVIFGTSALEVGVNLPNLDVVLITDPNIDMAAIKQRGGRCGRGGRDGLVVIDISDSGISAEGFLNREMRNSQPSQNSDIGKIHLLRLLSELCKKEDSLTVPIPATAIFANYPQVDLESAREFFIVENDRIKNNMTFSPHRKFMLFSPASYVPVIIHEKGKGMRKLGDTSNPQGFATNSTIVFRGESIRITKITNQRIDCIPYEGRDFNSGFLQSVITFNENDNYQSFDLGDIKFHYFNDVVPITISIIEETNVIAKKYYKTSLFKIEFVEYEYHYGALNALLRSARYVLGTDSFSYDLRTSKNNDNKVISFYDLERYGDGARRVGGNIEGIIEDTINRLTYCKCDNGCINCTYPLKGAMMLKKDVTKKNALKWMIALKQYLF